MAAQQIAYDNLMWCVIIHMTFMLSALGMAYVDKMNKHRDFSKSLAFGITVFF